MNEKAKLPISLVVVTLNDAEYLERCIVAASFCSEYVVVDSGSTDGTIEVAEKYGARVFHRNWNGYGEQKNFACEQASRPWILCVDQDEFVSDELRASIGNAFQTDPDCDAFDLNRHGVYAGQLINHSGWYPQWRTFLYRKGAATWGGMEPHVVVEFHGKSKRKLRGDLFHYTYRTIDEHLRKNISTARAAGKAMFDRGKRATLSDLCLRPAWAWFRCFILQLGFLDGFLGLVIANGQANYTFLKYAYLREFHVASTNKR